MKSKVAWIIFALYFLLAFYVGRMPRGEYFPTGDYVCINDGRGPCHESYVEELSHLDIPEWAKLVRRLDWFPIAILFFVALYFSKTE